MPQIAVIGLSSFGFYLAKKLSSLGTQVLAIDQKDTRVEDIKEYVDKAVIADATDKDVLSSLGLTQMEAVVLSLGESFASSILAAMHLKELGVKKVVAKALSEDHAKILEKIGVDRIIFPEKDMAERVAMSLQGTNVADFVPLGKDLSVIELKPLKEMVGKTLPELDFRNRYHCQVIAIKDKVPEEISFIPQAETRIKQSHLLIVVGNNKDLERLK